MGQSKSQHPVSFSKQIEIYVSLLIMCGHSSVWEYGYSFFKTSLETVEKLKNELIKLQAQAICLALGGKQSDWDKIGGF